MTTLLHTQAGGGCSGLPNAPDRPDPWVPRLIATTDTYVDSGHAACVQRVLRGLNTLQTVNFHVDLVIADDVFLERFRL